MKRSLLICGAIVLLTTACVDGPELGTDTAEAHAYKPMGFARVAADGAVTAQFSSAAGTVVARRYATGRYHVNFAGLGTGSGAPYAGNVQIVAEGANNLRCSLPGTVILSDVSQVYVDCFAPDASFADAAFSVLYHRALMPAPNSIPTYAAYSLIRANGTIYTYNGWSYDYNSSGVPNTVARVATGLYRVNITNGSAVNASVMVTPADQVNPANVCSVLSWSAGRVWVECRDRSSTLADTTFSLSYSTSGPTVDQQGAHAWFNGSVAHASYSAALGRMVTCSPASIAAFPIGARAWVTVSGDIGSWDEAPFVHLPFASKYGSAGYCKVESTATSGAAPSWAATSVVRCYNPDGSVVATPQFTFTAVTNEVTGPC